MIDEISDIQKIECKIMPLGHIVVILRAFVDHLVLLLQKPGLSAPLTLNSALHSTFNIDMTLLLDTSIIILKCEI